MAQYIPRQPVDTSTINAPTLKTGASAGPAIQGIGRVEIIDGGSRDWEKAFNVVAAGLDSAATKVEAVEDANVKEEIVKAHIAGVMADPYDATGDKRLQKAFDTGRSVRELREWSAETQDLMTGEWASLTPSEAATKMTERWKEKRVEYQSDPALTDSLDQYVTELMPHMATIHAGANKKIRQQQAGDSIAKDLSTDLLAVGNGEISAAQFGNKYNMYMRNGVYGLAPDDAAKAIGAAVSGLADEDLRNVDKPGYSPKFTAVVEALKNSPVDTEDPTSTLYHRGAAAEGLQRAEAQFTKALTGRVTLEKVSRITDLNLRADRGEVAIEDVFKANSEYGLGLSADEMVSLAHRSAKKASEAFKTSAAVGAYERGDLTAVAQMDAKDRNAAADALMERVQQVAGEDQDRAFRYLLSYMQQGLPFKTLAERNRMAVMAVPTNADGQVNPRLQQVLRDFQAARSAGIADLAEYFGGEEAVMRLSDMTLLMENGSDINAAAKQVAQATAGGEVARKDAQVALNKDRAMQKFFENELLDKPGINIFGAGTSETKDPRMYAEFVRLSEMYYMSGATGGSTEKAFDAAKRRLLSRAEMVNGTYVLRPAGSPSLAQKIGVQNGRTFEDAFNSYIASIPQENLHRLFPDVAADEAIEQANIKVRMNSSGDALMLMYASKEGITAFGAQHLPFGELALMEDSRKATFATIEALNADANMQTKVQQLEEDIYNMLEAGPQAAWATVPELYGLNASQWSDLPDKEKFTIMRDWQAREYNEKLGTVNGFRTAIGQALATPVSFDAFAPEDEAEKWKRVTWSVTRPGSLPARQSPEGKRLMRDRAFMSNEGYVTKALGLPRSYSAQLMLTRVVESDNGRFREQQGGGPAVGVYQMEPATAEDLLKWTAATSPDRFRTLMRMAGPKQDTLARAMLGAAKDPMSLERFRVPSDVINLVKKNDLFAAGLAAMHYYRYVGDNMPDDWGSRIETHIKEYNRGGKANRTHSERALKAHGLL